MLRIDNLQVSISDKQVLKGVSLSVSPGEIHAVMGPNGSGKSTLAHTLAGHPAYGVDGGSVTMQKSGPDVLEMSPDERARAGLFLAFQYPVEVAGVKVDKFLYLSHQARFGDKSRSEFPTLLSFRKYLLKLATGLSVNQNLLKRGLNEGFSGGEKKRLEILQMAVLAPKFAVLDETDSGLDIDAIKAVAAGVKQIVNKHKTGILVITHYQRILKFLEPDFVHVFVDGQVVESGDGSLASRLEKTGYRRENATSH